MNRCSKCLIPDTRPDTAFVDGVCLACLAYQKRPAIEWEIRRKELNLLLENHTNNGTGFDCIVPSSGGKDSTYQVLTLIELGAKPLVVTASTCHLTPLGRANIDNLKRYATTIEVTPNTEVRAKLNRLALTMVGDVSWPEHASIFTTPFRVAIQTGIPLIFYGENPQNQYGGPMASVDAREMTQRWVTEFGGFLGLRADDFVGMEGITQDDMNDYRLPPATDVIRNKIEAHFLGQYLPWDSERNARVAQDHGLRCQKPSMANYWACENLDNAQTGLHDHVMYRKYGYGRMAAQVSVDIRKGLIDRETALGLVNGCDGLFPTTYAGVDLSEVLDRIGMTKAELIDVLDQFTNWSLFDGEKDHRPLLKEDA